jgi:hypothetical protein
MKLFFKMSSNKYILHIELLLGRSRSTGGRIAAQHIATITRKVMNRNIFCLRFICLERNVKQLIVEINNLQKY